MGNGVEIIKGVLSSGPDFMAVTTMGIGVESALGGRWISFGLVTPAAPQGQRRLYGASRKPLPLLNAEVPVGDVGRKCVHVPGPDTRAPLQDHRVIGDTGKLRNRFVDHQKRHAGL